MLNYFIQVMLFQALFLAIYDLFLQKETFFKWNRVYLLLMPIVAFVIPLIKLNYFNERIPQEYVVQLPTVFLNPQSFIENSVPENTTFNYVPFIFYGGILFFTALFLFRLYKIYKLYASGRVEKYQNYTLVILAKKQSAFSFFNFIFIHESYVKNNDLQVINHELVHCKQHHTFDLLLMEILKIALWFNPFIYLFQKRITILHEYISDNEVVSEVDKKTYFNKILSETFSVENIAFINQFYKQSLIKKRIVMITKNKSKQIKKLKYLLLLPVLTAMLFYTSCTKGIDANIEDVENVINNSKAVSEGKYFKGKYGKMFLGSSLEGKEILYEDYTESEKELFEKFNSKAFSNIEMKIVIDTNGDRVLFLKTDFKTDSLQKKYEYEKGEDIPFSEIDEVPVFPGCEGTQEELKACMQNKIMNHISSNFNADLANELGLQPGIKRIFVLFKIDENGAITDIKARAPHQSLADEAIRVIESLPTMIPGKQKGEVVGVKYSLPIAFKVE